MYHKFRFDHDKDGVKFQHPERSCSWCSKFPCIEGLENFDIDFAKYGCFDFEEK